MSGPGGEGETNEWLSRRDVIEAVVGFRSAESEDGDDRTVTSSGGSGSADSSGAATASGSAMRLPFDEPFLEIFVGRSSPGATGGEARLTGRETGRAGGSISSTASTAAARS